MSELSIPNLVLGIVGTVTGVIALFISYWTYRRGTPRIKVKALKCVHYVEPNLNQMSFWAKFLIKNLGDSGTSINDVDLVFVSDKEYHLKKEYFRGRKFESQRKWINPHQTIDLEVDYWTEKYSGEDKESINCSFSIYHTHGRITEKATSQREQPPPRQTQFF